MADKINTKLQRFDKHAEEISLLLKNAIKAYPKGKLIQEKVRDWKALMNKYYTTHSDEENEEIHVEVTEKETAEVNKLVTTEREHQSAILDYQNQHLFDAPSFELNISQSPQTQEHLESTKLDTIVKEAVKTVQSTFEDTQYEVTPSMLEQIFEMEKRAIDAAGEKGQKKKDVVLSDNNQEEQLIGAPSFSLNLSQPTPPTQQQGESRKLDTTDTMELEKTVPERIEIEKQVTGLEVEKEQTVDEEERRMKAVAEKKVSNKPKPGQKTSNKDEVKLKKEAEIKKKKQVATRKEGKELEKNTAAPSSFEEMLRNIQINTLDVIKEHAMKEKDLQAIKEHQLKTKRHNEEGKSGGKVVSEAVNFEKLITELPILRTEGKEYKTPQKEIVIDAEPISAYKPEEQRPERKKKATEVLCSPYIQRQVKMGVKRTANENNTSQYIYAGHGEAWYDTMTHMTQ
jgi:hypothetical protein